MTATPEDIEILPATEQPTGPLLQVPSKSQAKNVVVVDDNHPFDLETYLSGYTGRTYPQRAIFIAQHAPTLAPAAYEKAIEQLKAGKDVATYTQALSAYNALPNVTQKPQDQSWLDTTLATNSKDRERLEADLKTYTSNMIKESVRMSHRELGKYYCSVGDFSAALRNHMKSREFCTTANHVIEMCISVLEILLEQQNYAHLSTYIYKAETALDASQGAAGAGGASGRKASTSAPNPDRSRVQTQLEFAGAMAEMGAGRYDKAAYAFLKMKRDLGDWAGKIVLPGDIAVYGALCALASLSRSAIKAAVVESETFGSYLEQEPYIREILDAYMASKFKDVLLLLDRYASRHSLDLHLSHHVNELHRRIRDRALVLYFQPFASVRLDRMAIAFGMELSDMEASVVRLIEEGLIKARIDSQNKILKAKDHDPRIELYNRAVAAGLGTQSSTQKLLWRMKLIQNDVLIKQPKSAQQGQNLGPQQQAALWEQYSPPE